MNHFIFQTGIEEHTVNSIFHTITKPIKEREKKNDRQQIFSAFYKLWGALYLDDPGFYKIKVESFSMGSAPQETPKAHLRDSSVSYTV